MAGASGAPVCLIQGGADGLCVTEEGISVLESLAEPVAIVCLAGQYRTGKSFFLNQLASHRGLDAAGAPNGGVSNGASGTNGFRVGPTTESCTRGIWLWAPNPPIRNPAGQLVLFLDTEGMASTDNDESYDAKIFSLGLLLSSLFVFNTMGVIDEGAIDRLYLVSELTKHVCVNAHPTTAPSSTSSLSSNGVATGESALAGDALMESRALAPHFPPFVWLLRDFLLDMQVDGSKLTANEYLENALDARDVSATASESTRMRQEERNRTRASIRVLFGRRECVTLVRPVTDERELRRAAELSDDELRPEFVEQMAAVRRRLLSAVAAKELLGKVLQGPQVAQLVRCYTDTLNSGAIPDIKAAWEYVSDATCQAALAAAIEMFDTRMEATNCQKDKTPTKVADDEDGDEDEEEEEITEVEEDDDGATILSQTEFEKIYKEAQEQALTLFKMRSVEGASRAICFQKLKQHMHAERTAQIARLQKRSSRFCAKVLAKLRARFLMRPLAAGAWDAAADKAEAFQATMDVLEEVYENEARGPAKKKAFYQFLRVDAVVFFEALFQRLADGHAQAEAKWERSREQLEHAHANEKADWKEQLQAKAVEAQHLVYAKTLLEEKVATQVERIAELQHTSEKQVATIAELEEQRDHLKGEINELHAGAADLTKELEKMQLRLQHKEESLHKVETEAQHTKQELTEQVEALRAAHQSEKEEWMRRAADQTAEKMMLQKQLKKSELDVQKQEREMDLLGKEQQQLQQLYDAELEARRQQERDCAALRDQNDKLKQQLEESSARRLSTERTAERERVRLEMRLERFQMQLGRLEGDREVEEVLRDCVSEVVRLADEEKLATLQEERLLLQEQLGELHVKIATLPDFYVRQIFCAPEPVPSFFEALTSVVGNPSEW